MAKFKVGDTVKVVSYVEADRIGHIGKIMEVITKPPVIYPYDISGIGLMLEEELELAPPNILEEVAKELERANKHGKFASAHEGFAILLEEVDELKEHVWMKQSERNLGDMRKEAIQVAAMAVKFVQMIDEGRGR
jgi:hypothetical protein